VAKGNSSSQCLFELAKEIKMLQIKYLFMLYIIYVLGK